MSSNDHFTKQEQDNSALTEPLIQSTDALEVPVDVEAVVASSNVINVTVDQELLQIDENEWAHGEVQDFSCRDVFFAILFLLQVVVVLYFSTVGIASAESLVPANSSNDDSQTYDLSKVTFFLLSLAASVIGISSMTMLLLLGPLAQMMIQVSLVMSPVTNFLASVMCLVVGQVVLAGFLFVVSLIGLCYAVGVWRRIPFASANVTTAMAALKENKGLFALNFFVVFTATGWLLLWGFAIAQVTMQEKKWIYECHIDTGDDTFSQEDNCQVSTRGKIILFAFLLSLYWTSQVIKNCFHTTVAGVIGTWWFTPEADRPKGFCNTTIYNSWLRSTIYSFGSICLGSLLVAVLQVLQVIVSLARSDDRNSNGANSILWCLLQCLVDILERVMEYINQWAFVYVGLYGYDYCTAGKNVYQLFKARGWSVIINDQLVSRSLGFLQFWIGVVSGAIGVLLGLVFLMDPVTGGFLGFILGLVLSNILFSVVNSAVDTVVVCFAESPSTLRLNHPAEISQRLFDTWKEVYPSECCW
mmetsp:Transcript_3074/g.4659  ORF Transcript_3074/g.4659 Transcript_3074/m.4659 type:complete len:528 (+) Transcript_3074:73-1656(+)